MTLFLQDTEGIRHNHASKSTTKAWVTHNIGGHIKKMPGRNEISTFRFQMKSRHSLLSAVADLLFLRKSGKIPFSSREHLLKTAFALPAVL